jgi:Glycosyl transferase family 41
MQGKASADIALDTWEFGGHTTSVDSLWAGVPVLTFAGPSLMSRVSSSLLIHLGQYFLAYKICLFGVLLLFSIQSLPLWGFAFRFCPLAFSYIACFRCFMFV